MGVYVFTQTLPDKVKITPTYTWPCLNCFSPVPVSAQVFSDLRERRQLAVTCGCLPPPTSGVLVVAA